MEMEGERLDLIRTEKDEEDQEGEEVRVCERHRLEKSVNEFQNEQRRRTQRESPIENLLTKGRTPRDRTTRLVKKPQVA